MITRQSAARRPGRLSRALERQTRCRERYRQVIGSAYEAGAYAQLLEATREVVALRRGSLAA